MRLEQWAVVRAQISPYLPPETAVQQLHGNVFGHPTFPDNSSVTTSAIVGKRVIDLGEGAAWEGVVTKSGNVYLLGKAETEYEALFPGCTERLMNSLPEV